MLWAGMEFLDVDKTNKIMYVGVIAGKDGGEFRFFAQVCVCDSAANADDLVRVDERVVGGQFGISYG